MDVVKSSPNTNDVSIFDGVENGHIFRILSLHSLTDQLPAHLCVCVYVCVCARVSVCVCMCECVCVCTCECVCTCICVIIGMGWVYTKALYGPYMGMECT